MVSHQAAQQEPDSPDSPAARPTPTSSVSLAAVHGALSLFAEAIAGRPIPIEVVAEDRACWPWQPSTSSSQVVLAPVHLDAFSTPEANRIALRAAVLHQLMAVVGSDSSHSAGEQPFEPPAGVEPAIYGRVVAMLEDLRIDAATRDRFPGAVVGLDQLVASARALEPDVGGTKIDQALSALRLRSLGADNRSLINRFPAIAAATISELLACADSVDSATATRRDSLDAAVRICRLLVEPDTAERASRRHAPEVEAPAEDHESSIDETRGASLDPTATPSEVEPGALSGGQISDELPSGSVREPGREPAADQLGFVVGTQPDTRGGPRRRTYVYDEWDYHAQAYLPAWCRVVEEHLVGDDHSFILDVRSRHVALRNRIRRSFARLRPTELVRIHRSIDGDDFDIDATIEAVVDRRGGAPPDDRLHIRRDRARRDVATAFLLDLSASTSAPAVVVEPAPSAAAVVDPYDDPLSWMPFDAGPTEPERRVIDIAKDAVALMGDALRELGDDHAIYGFSGTGRDNVDFKIAKDFGDRVSPGSWAAVAEMKPLRYTRMGPAIRHATTKLAAQPARTRLLIVISDGYPQDTDYGDDRSDKDYGIHDTARALTDAHVLGVETFCVTIDPAGHDYLRRMCPDHRYLVIDEVESLPEELAKLYLALSTG